jgi:hypothetical protein
MNDIIECCICMEQIDGMKNKCVTDCGHTFHTKCLITNVSHNGFGCPYCRSEMTEKSNVDEDEEDDDDDDFFRDEFEERDSEYELRGMRMMFQLNETGQINEEEIEAEETYANEQEESEESNEDTEVPVSFIQEKLKRIKIDYDDLLKAYILENFQTGNNVEMYNTARSVYGKLNAIIEMYKYETSNQARNAEATNTETSN